jgi:hypothetical protein
MAQISPIRARPPIASASPGQSVVNVTSSGGGIGPIVYINTSGGPASHSLPTDHSDITLCEDSGTYNIITVTDPGGALINGQSSFAGFNQPYANYTFRWNGSQWRVF